MDFRDWTPSTSTTRRMSSVWKGIVTIAEFNNTLLEFYMNNFQLKIGDGNNVRFWVDKWWNRTSLREEFLGLFGLVVNKEESLRSMHDQKVAEGNWVCQFRRRLYEWEVNEVIRLRNFLAAAPTLVPDQIDCPVWNATSSGVFSVCSAYTGLLASAGPLLRSTKLVWIPYMPPKVQFFTWSAWRNRVKTAVYLQRIGALNNFVSSLCVFCTADSETVNHVLISCPFAWKVWSAMLLWWHVVGALPKSVDGVLLWWEGQCVRSQERKIWRGVPLVVLWSIWQHRNAIVFKASAPNLGELCEVIKVRIALWLKPRFSKHHFSVQDFLVNLRQVRCCITGRRL